MPANNVTDMVPIDAVFGRRPAPTPWPPSRAALALVVEVLPALNDALAADLVVHLAVLLVDRDEALHVTRELLAGALAMTHTQHGEIVRLQRRLADLLEERRQARTAAA